MRQDIATVHAECHTVLDALFILSSFLTSRRDQEAGAGLLKLIIDKLEGIDAKLAHIETLTEQS